MSLTKLLNLLLLLLFTGLAPNASAQKEQKGWELKYHFADKDTAFDAGGLKLESRFDSYENLSSYVSSLPSLLRIQGFPLASVDSIWMSDSLTNILLYAGEKHTVVSLKLSGIDAKALEATGYRQKQFIEKPFNISQLQQAQKKLLNYFENNGYPFASVYLDSISINNGNMYALLKAEPSVFYHLDSIRIFGKAKIKKHFLERYLGLPKGSVYNGERLRTVDKKVADLPFLKTSQPSEITMTGSGALLDLYLEQRRNSQASFLIGFIPDASQNGKLLLTGDVLLDLKNTLGNGENILFKWQQLQRNSPRLNLGFTLPYILRSNFGIDILFDLYKKDSSYLQVNGQFGLVYSSSASQTGKLILQWQSTGILQGGIDTAAVKLQRKLPDIMDVSSVNTGLQYEFLKTNYRLNPKKGWEGNLLATVGIKRIRQSADILSLKDPDFNFASLYDSVQARSYQLRARIVAARFFPVARQTVFKWGINTGAYFSKDIFRNDLFQIGGFRTLRGFDEEAIFTDRYLINTTEFRLLVGQNSYLFLFADVAWAKNSVTETSNRFFGAGLGLVFETKLGLLNISYAAGKRNDVPFNLREGSKLHFGYSSYF